MNPWYTVSYSSFLNQPVRTKADLIRLIAFAYSWMPTIPEVHAKKADWDQLLGLIRDFKGRKNCRKELFRRLVPLVNNSIVGASKVFHFIAPDQAPILDSRVAKAWNLRYSKDKEHYPVKMPSTFYYKDKKKLNKLIDIYEVYCTSIINLAAKKHKSIRDLELELFKSGGRK